MIRQQMKGTTTLDLVRSAIGTEKFTVLAAVVDEIKADYENQKNKISLDEEIETLRIDELAKRFGATERTLRDQLEREIGPGCVVKIGKHWVIRKRKYLEFLARRERP